MRNLATNIKTDIRFRPDGNIELSKKVTTLLNLKHGDYISFFQDEEELYIYKYASAEDNLSCKGKCVSSRKGSKFMRVTWKEICTRIITEDNRATEARYRVGEPTMYQEKLVLPIITRKNYAAGN